MREIVITSNDAGRRLDRFLRKYLPGASLGEIYKMIRKDVKVDGKRAAESYILCEGDTLRLRVIHVIVVLILDGIYPVNGILDVADREENRKLFYAGKMPFGIVIYLNPDNGEIKQINTLKQLDDFERFCEFPDVHDNIQNNGIG